MHLHPLEAAALAIHKLNNPVYHFLNSVHLCLTQYLCQDLLKFNSVHTSQHKRVFNQLPVLAKLLVHESLTYIGLNVIERLLDCLVHLVARALIVLDSDHLLLRLSQPPCYKPSLFWCQQRFEHFKCFFSGGHIWLEYLACVLLVGN